MRELSSVVENDLGDSTVAAEFAALDADLDLVAADGIDAIDAIDAIGSVDDKVDLRAELDFGEAEWHTVPSSEDRVLELSFVPHTDGVTYVAMRQASSQESPVLVFTPSEWDAFLAGAREGQFDRENAG